MSDSEMRAWIQRMPKVELHVHLEGAIRPTTLLELAAKNGVDLPQDPDTVYAFDDFQEFLQVYMRVAACLCTQEDFERITYEFLLDEAAQGVRYCEVLISAMQHLKRGFALEWVMQGVQAGYRRAQAETGIRMGVLFDHGRQFGAEEGWRVLEQALRARRYGVVGLSIGGDEENYPPELFTDLFQEARQAGLAVTAHAGEVRGPESVWGAIRALGVQRIGHGIRSIEDPALLAYLREQQIYLDICPTSNVLTGAVPSLEAHPVRSLYEAGVPITLSSDDPAIFRTNLVEEYRLLSERFGFDRGSLWQISLNGVRAAFLPASEKAALAEQFRAEFPAG